MKKWAEKYNAKLIFEVRDIWPLSLTELLHIPSYNPLIMYLKHLEKFAYKHADHVVSLLGNAYEHMQTKGLKRSKFTYIPNGVDISDDNIATNKQNSIEDLRKSGQFIVLYTGSHGEPNALQPLLEAARILKTKNLSSIKIILLGKGNKKSELQEYARLEGLSNVLFYDPVPREEVMSYLASADVCFLSWHNTPLYRYGVSANKIFEYMLAGKPILQAIDSPGNPVDLAKCGKCVSPMDAEAIANAIIELSSTPKNELTLLGENSLNFVKSNHSYHILAKKYSDLFNETHA